ncbi:hypothetical protein LCGC14_0341420 [marine sediment metagenome]|uniref:Uncharacterized protein n=1 Tax=marine sediment metagenome TaxID=412755 RepID=A0A0F9TDN5_9ZZZZ
MKREEGKPMGIAKWRDGSDKLCSECGEPIFTFQPMVSTTTQIPKKRHCRHFLCFPQRINYCDRKWKGYYLQEY